jgi:hypothetical protein
MESRGKPYRFLPGPKRMIARRLTAHRESRASVTITWGKIMKKILLVCVSLAAVGLSSVAHAADPAAKGPCPYGGDPYKNYNCLDPYLGTDFFSRFINYYRLEWGHEAAPADPKAPPSRRE